jgi:hypothetical protein
MWWVVGIIWQLVIADLLGLGTSRAPGKSGGGPPQSKTLARYHKQKARQGWHICRIRQIKMDQAPIGAASSGNLLGICRS